MSTLVFVAAVILGISGILCALVYIWLNAFSKISDAADRNSFAISMIIFFAASTVISGLLSCLYAEYEAIFNTMYSVAIFFAYVAAGWFVVLVLCAATAIYLMVSRILFKKKAMQALKKLAIIAIVETAVPLFLSWLFI